MPKQLRAGVKPGDGGERGLRGPAGASPDARATGGVGRSQGRGRWETSHPNMQEGRSGGSDGSATATASQGSSAARFWERSRMVPGVTAGARGWSPALFVQRGQDSRVRAGEISTRGDCAIACGSVEPPARPESRSRLLRLQGQSSLQPPASLPVIPAQAPNALRIPPGYPSQGSLQPSTSLLVIPAQAADALRIPPGHSSPGSQCPRILPAGHSLLGHRGVPKRQALGQCPGLAPASS